MSQPMLVQQLELVAGACDFCVRCIGWYQQRQQDKSLVPCSEALAEGDLDTVAQLMNTNFDLRRRMFGDAALGAVNLRMIELARSVGGTAIYSYTACTLIRLMSSSAVDAVHEQYKVH